MGCPDSRAETSVPSGSIPAGKEDDARSSSGVKRETGLFSLPVWRTAAASSASRFSWRRIPCRSSRYVTSFNPFQVRKGVLRRLDSPQSFLIWRPSVRASYTSVCRSLRGLGITLHRKKNVFSLLCSSAHGQHTRFTRSNSLLQCGFGHRDESRRKHSEHNERAPKTGEKARKMEMTVIAPMASRRKGASTRIFAREKQ